MTAWSEGYVSDVPYLLGFYREAVPAHIAFAAACVGRHPGLALRPKRVLELGIGMGLHVVINAAVNPRTQFEGVDFNPLHVAHAQGLADEAALDNVSAREASFQDLARETPEGRQDLDLIVAHGILTWISAEAREAVVEIARKRLKPGGLLYVSYNCMPGWAPVLPLQRFLREHAKRAAGRSDQQVGAGLDLARALMAEGAGYFRANPGLRQHVEKMSPANRNYLAHEYLNAHWSIFHFADVAELFDRAKLDFVGSATLVENGEPLAVPEGTRARIAAETDPVFKETLRDIASNKRFRRDLFARGADTLGETERAALLGAMRFALAVPRAKVKFRIATPVGEIDGDAGLYGAVADLLAQKTASLAEIAALPAFRQGGAGYALEALVLLVHSGQVLPVAASGSAGAEPDPGPGRRLNRVIVGKMLRQRVFRYLAAPLAGSAIRASHSDLLMASALLSGQDEAVETMTGFVVRTMQRLGIDPTKDGKPVTDPAERHHAVRAEAETFLSETLPMWRRLGVL